MITFFQHIAIECHQGNTTDLSMIHVCLFVCLFGYLMKYFTLVHRGTRPRSEMAIILIDTFGQTVDKNVSELWFDLVRKP